MKVARNGGVTGTYKLDSRKAISAQIGSPTLAQNYSVNSYGTIVNTPVGRTGDYVSQGLIDGSAKTQTPTLFQLAKSSGQLTGECLSIAARIRESLFSEGSGSQNGVAGEISYGLQSEIQNTLSDLEQLRDSLYRIEIRIVAEKSK